ncbi:SixA phosphatase family protein [Neolewinella aurantiaca]|nr:histidine phosphatase family protein [Neolewinella aurantiaca]
MKTPYFLAVFFLAFLFVACGSDANPEMADVSGSEAETNAETVIFLSRHAEKAEGEDPELLPAGEARAERIAQHLSVFDFSAVYATDFVRTRATAAPIAREAGVAVQTYSADASPETLTKEWLTKHRGETIFVVGHSNTIPKLVNTLIGTEKYQDIDDDDYDGLFRVSVKADGKAGVRKMNTKGQ